MKEEEMTAEGSTNYANKSTNASATNAADQEKIDVSALELDAFLEYMSSKFGKEQTHAGYQLIT